MKKWDWWKITKRCLWTLVVFEYVALAVGVFLSVGYHVFGWLDFLRKYYESNPTKEAANYLLPSPEHNGLAGLSYLSVTTGLNLAMVKFEVFKKSIKDIEEQWKNEMEAQLGAGFENAFENIKADDVLRAKMRRLLEKHCRGKLKESYDQHLDFVMCWRAAAIPLVVLGIAALFFQFSAGAFGILFVIPVLGAWLAKLICKVALRGDVAALIPFATEIANEQLQEQANLRLQVEDVIQQASKQK